MGEHRHVSCSGIYYFFVEFHTYIYLHFASIFLDIFAPGLLGPSAHLLDLLLQLRQLRLLVKRGHARHALHEDGLVLLVLLATLARLKSIL
jgi:hypothetical protein